MNTLLAIITTLTFPAASVTNGICEVSTNAPLPVCGERLGELRLTLVADATPSNNFEIALGHAGAGGHLAFLDEDLRLGCDCGAWYAANTVDGTREMWQTQVRPDFATSTTNVWTLARREIGRSWDTLRLTRRGAGDGCATLTLEAEKVYTVIVIR